MKTKLGVLSILSIWLFKHRENGRLYQFQVIDDLAKHGRQDNVQFPNGSKSCFKATPILAGILVMSLLKLISAV